MHAWSTNPVQKTSLNQKPKPGQKSGISGSLPPLNTDGSKGKFTSWQDNKSMFHEVDEMLLE